MYTTHQSTPCFIFCFVPSRFKMHHTTRNNDCQPHMASQPVWICVLAINATSSRLLSLSPNQSLQLGTFFLIRVGLRFSLVFEKVLTCKSLHNKSSRPPHYAKFDNVLYCIGSYSLLTRTSHRTLIFCKRRSGALRNCFFPNFAHQSVISIRVPVPY